MTIKTYIKPIHTNNVRTCYKCLSTSVTLKEHYREKNGKRIMGAPTEACSHCGAKSFFQGVFQRYSIEQRDFGKRIYDNTHKKYVGWLASSLNKSWHVLITGSDTKYAFENMEKAIDAIPTIFSEKNLQNI